MKKAIKILAIVCLGMFLVGCTDAKTISNSASGEHDNNNSQINVTEASNLSTDNYSVSNQNGEKNNATTNANDAESSEEIFMRRTIAVCTVFVAAAAASF